MKMRIENEKILHLCWYLSLICIGHRYEVSFYFTAFKCKTGENVNVGGNSKIFDHDFHSTSYLHRRKGRNNFENIKMSAFVIENNVFIGCNSIILKGVYIGAGSIIGAGSVVSCKYISPDSLVIGNPAKIISNNKIEVN